jgi:DNA repair protein SbcD/Mre11
LKILHFADLHIGVENYGKVNPTTGLNTRLEDFVKSFDLLVENAIHEKVDLVIFAGDAFKINEPSNTHQRLFAQRVLRLAQADIPVFLLIGNHDQTNRYGESHALDIYATLDIPKVWVSGRPQIQTIPTRSGPLQIVSLPHVSKSALLTVDDFASQTLAEVDRSIVEQVDDILTYFGKQIDPEIPAFLVAHVGVDQAKMGSEQSMSIGYGFTVPLHILARSEYKYVALGHIHKHQVLCQDPPVIYPGSLDRVDFGEEKEDKGYMQIELYQDKVEYEFIPLPCRPFVTIEKNLSESEDPTADLLKVIEKTPIQDSIVRLLYTIQTQRAEEIDTKQLKKALEGAFHASIRPLLEDHNERIRMPDLAEAEPLHPLKTLDLYLQRRTDLSAVQTDLMQRAEGLWQELEKIG